MGLLVPLLLGGCIVALDVAKEKFVAAVATIAGEVLKLVRFRHPEQTLAFVRMVENLHRQVDGKVQVAMDAEQRAALAAAPLLLGRVLHRGLLSARASGSSAGDRRQSGRREVEGR